MTAPPNGLAATHGPLGLGDIALPSPEELEQAAAEALRWVAGRELPQRRGGAWWSRPHDPEDSLYEGTAGVLLAFAIACRAGLDAVTGPATRAAHRLIDLVAEQASPPGLYVGAAGYATALSAWAAATGDRDSAAAASLAVDQLARQWSPDDGWGPYDDVISGDAGVLLTLLAHGRLDVAGPAAARLAGAGRPHGVGLHWRMQPEVERLLPGFSHGTAGIGYALGRSAEVLGRADLLDTAVVAGRTMLELGDHGDGAWRAPRVLPCGPAGAEYAFGWCHGPTGSLRLFSLLDRLEPGAGWEAGVAAARRAVRDSGLPQRQFPGFWDNLGQCCGTAGVGEMALDAFGQTGDGAWRDWALALARDVLDRGTRDEEGLRWSNTAHTADPPALPAEAGWAQGAAGIAAWLARLGAACRGRSDPAAGLLPDAV